MRRNSLFLFEIWSYIIYPGLVSILDFWSTQKMVIWYWIIWRTFLQGFFFPVGGFGEEEFSHVLIQPAVEAILYCWSTQIKPLLVVINHNKKQKVKIFYLICMKCNVIKHLKEIKKKYIQPELSPSKKMV